VVCGWVFKGVKLIGVAWKQRRIWLDDTPIPNSWEGTDMILWVAQGVVPRTRGVAQELRLELLHIIAELIEAVVTSSKRWLTSFELSDVILDLLELGFDLINRLADGAEFCDQ